MRQETRRTRDPGLRRGAGRGRSEPLSRPPRECQVRRRPPGPRLLMHWLHLAGAPGRSLLPQACPGSLTPQTDGPADGGRPPTGVARDTSLKKSVAMYFLKVCTLIVSTRSREKDKEENEEKEIPQIPGSLLHPLHPGGRGEALRGSFGKRGGRARLGCTSYLEKTGPVHLVQAEEALEAFPAFRETRVQESPLAPGRAVSCRSVSARRPRAWATPIPVPGPGLLLQQPRCLRL